MKGRMLIVGMLCWLNSTADAIPEQGFFFSGEAVAPMGKPISLRTENLKLGNSPSAATGVFPDSSVKADSAKHHKPFKFDLFGGGGIGIPLGKFSVGYANYLASAGGGGTVGFKGEGGFAEPGPYFCITAEIPYKQSCWGFAGLVGYSSNGFNMNDYAAGYSYHSPVYYNSLGFLPGLFARFSGERLTLNFRLAAGALICRSPNLAYSGDSIAFDFQHSTLDTLSISRVINPAWTAAFAFGGGMSLIYNFTPKWLLTLNIDFLAAYPTFAAGSLFTTNGQTTASTTFIYCPVSQLTFSVAVGYHFGP